MLSPSQKLYKKNITITIPEINVSNLDDYTENTTKALKGEKE